METFNKIVLLILKEKKQKKELSGYDYYIMIRKPTPPSGSAFKDKSKYSRKQKHRNNFND